MNERVARSGLAQHFEPFGVENKIGIAALVDALADFLLRLIETVELVEADIMRPHADSLADMPFA